MAILLLVIVIIIILALVVTCHMYTSHYWLSVTDRCACGVNPKPSMFVIKLKACLYYQVTVFMLWIAEYPQEIFWSIGLKYVQALNGYSPTVCKIASQLCNLSLCSEGCSHAYIYFLYWHKQ